MKRFFTKNWDGNGEFDAKETYDANLKRAKEGLGRRAKREGREIFQSEIEKVEARESLYYRATIEENKEVDKLNKDIAIIVPTHSGHLPWIRACLNSIKPLGYYILLAFDAPFWKSKDLHRILPPPEVLSMADAIVMKHRTWMPSVGVCHFWNMIYGLKLINGWGFKYVFNINGDCILEKPDNFHKIVEMLGDADIISNHWEPKRGYCGTMGLLAKADMLEDFYLTYFKEMHIKLGTTEGRLGKFIKENNINIVPVKSPINDRFKLPNPDCDWYNILGFRHLHAEHKVRLVKRMEPVEEKYFDFGPNNIFMSRSEYDILMKYWRTGEKKYLEQWWK